MTDEKPYPSPPQDLEAEMELARGLSESAREVEAEAVYRRCLAQAPQCVPVLIGLGLMLRRRGDHAAALQYLNTAAAVKPEEVGIRLEIALTHRQMHELEKAESIYRQILDQHPRHVVALLELGTIALSRLDWPAANAFLGTAAAEDPANLSVQLELGRALSGLARLEGAEKVFRGIVERAPDFVPARVELGLLLRRCGAADEAVSHLRAAVAASEAARSGAAPAVRVELARALWETRRFEEAADEYGVILAGDPGNVTALVGLGQVAWDQGRRSDALVHLKAALAVNPLDLKINLQVGGALMDQWQLDEAESAFRHVLALESGNASALLGLGRCAGFRGNSDEAIAFFRAAAASAPDNQAVRLEIAQQNLDSAAYDWRSELLGAVEVLRADTSTPDDRFEAAKLLLEYGVTDLVPLGLGPVEKTSPWARRLLQAARQLERLGLSQTSDALAGGAPAESDQLNRLTGVVERLREGSDTLVLVFCGRLHRVYLSLDVMHRILRTTGASLVYLRDLERTRYLGGVVGLGDNIFGTLDALRRLRERAGARRLLTIGHCIGCSGALRYGIALGAEAVLGVTPRIGAPTLRGLSPKGAAKLAALRASAPEFARDVASLYLSSSSRPRVTLISGMDVEPDASFARDLAARVPGVAFVGLPGAYTDSFSDLLARGLLTPLLSGFVANAEVAPELLESLGRAAPDTDNAAGEPAARETRQ